MSGTGAGEACGKAKADELAEVLLVHCTTSRVVDPRVLATAKWKATHGGSLDGVPIVVTAEATRGVLLFGSGTEPHTPAALYSESTRDSPRRSPGARPPSALWR